MFTVNGNTFINGNVTSTNLTITGLGSSGSPCLTVSATGVVATSTCAAGGSGTVTTSSAVSVNNFPFWTSGSALSGTSTLTVSGANLFAGGAFNASGTITQNGTAVSTATNTVSLTNGSNYITFASSGVFSAGLTFTGGLTINSTATFNSSTVIANVTSSILATDSTGKIVATTTAAGGSGTISTSTALTTNAIPLITAYNTLGNSAIVSAAGGFSMNGNQIIDGGSNWAYNVVQPTGANVIIQAPTGTMVAGGFVQGGTLSIFNTSTTLTTSTFCGTGEGFVQNTTGTITITIPATSTIVNASCNTGNQKIYAGTWATQQIYNNSTNSVQYATTGDNEVQIYSAGTPTLQPPNTLMTITGLFSSSTQTQFATGTGQTLYLTYTLAQTSTPFTVSSNNVAVSSAGTLNVSSTANFSATTTVSANMSVKQIYEPVYDNGSTTANTTINWDNGNKQMVALATSTQTLSFSNVKNGASYTLWLMQDGTGSRTVTWTTTGTGRVQWVNGNTAPTLTTAANTMDVVSFQCFVPHTTTTLSCYGMYGVNNFAQ